MQLEQNGLAAVHLGGLLDSLVVGLLDCWVVRLLVCSVVGIIAEWNGEDGNGDVDGKGD